MTVLSRNAIRVNERYGLLTTVTNVTWDTSQGATFTWSLKRDRLKMGSMENERGTVRRLCLFIVLITYGVCSFASDPPFLKPVATLVLAEMNPSDQAGSAWATVAFSSEKSIAVGLCRQDCASKECSLVLVRWERGTLQPFAETRRFNSGLSIHPASAGQIFAGQSWLSTTSVYSADLSTVRELPIDISAVSATGKTAGERAKGSWKLYRLTDSLEPLREGIGDLRSVSDEAVVIQNGKAVKVETLDGRPLGSFTVSDEVSGFHAALVGNDKLYLPDCRRTLRMVDFKGKTKLTIHQPGLCGLGDTTSSADGRRILFDFTDHKTSGLQHVFENIQTIISLGMVGPEDFNREEVRVFDTATGKSCFDWHRSFPMTYSQIRSAAISPSGEFVAIASESTLSIYQLPAVCEGQTVAPRK